MNLLMDPEAEAVDLGRSIVIEGGEGCGKTHVAIKRFIAALVGVEHSEEVLFLVDDEAAVEKVRGAVRKELADSESDLSKHDAGRSWNLAAHPECLHVHTLASLSLALVEAAPVSSGCGAGVRITADPDAYYRTASRALLRTLDHDDGVAPNLETLLLHLDNDLVRAETLLAALLRRRAELHQCVELASPEENRSTLQSALEDAVVMTLTEVSAAIPDDVSDELVTVSAMAGKHLSLRGDDSPVTFCRDLNSLPSADAANLRAWRGLCTLLLDDDGRLRQEFDEAVGFPPAADASDDKERSRRIEMQSRAQVLVARLSEIPGFTQRLAAVSEIADVRYTHLQWTVLQSLLAVLPRVIADLSRAFRALGEMDITEVLQGAIRALQAGHAEIFGPQGLRHIVVDNMHELSLLGAKLLESLTRSWTGEDERSLLVTGNAFASIRRSEGAQPAQYLKLLNSGLGKIDLSLVSLGQQQRSGSAIVRWINDIFAGDETAIIGEGAMPFVAADPVSEHSGEVRIHALSGPVDIESEWIARLITGSPALAEGSTAVLLGDPGLATSVVDSLRRAGIGCRSEAVEQLGQRSTVQDLHALTRALCHLADRVAWLTVLRAPWCGLTLDDLHRLCADSTDVAVWELVIDEQRRSRLSEDGQQRLSRIKRVFAQSLAERGRRDLRRLIEGVWTALGGAVCIADDRELQQTREFFRMLERIDDGGEPDSLEALDAAVERLEMSVAGTEGVLVTTIRQAARRQFDHVILAGLSTVGNESAGDRALRWLVRPDQYGKPQLLLAPVSGEGAGDAINDWLAALQTRMNDNELRRLFYAGATRADQSLHVVTRTLHGDDGWHQPPAHSPLGAMWPSLRDQLPDEPAVAEADLQRAPVVRTIRRLPSSWLLPESPQPKQWQATETQARPVADQPGGERHADILSKVMRRTLAEIGTLGPVDWAMRSLDGLENNLQQLLAMMGISHDEVPGMADRAGLAIRNMLDEERGAWLLSAGHDNKSAPLRLTGWLDSRLIDAEIDVSFVENGSRWIIGYDFAREISDELIEGLRPLWNDFAGLARRYDPTPVRIGVYFPFAGGWREWDSGS